MLRIAIYAIALFCVSTISRAQNPLEKPILEPESPPPKSAKEVHAVLAKDEHKQATTKFSSDLPKIRAYWQGKALDAGDKIGVLWLAEEVGIAPKDSEITRAVAVAYKSDEDGVFALARPEGGWPLGKYRCEVYLNGKLADSIDFAIEKGAEIELH